MNWKATGFQIELGLVGMKIQHFAAVTSVLQILFVLRVMFRVYVYWSGSDTYPVFRTRFSPTKQLNSTQAASHLTCPAAVPGS